MIDGEVVLHTSEASVLLRPGDYALIPLGQPHALANLGSDTARWAPALSAPAPRADHGATRTSSCPARTRPVSGRRARPERRDRSGHPARHMDPVKQSQELLAASAACDGLLVYSGITVKMMIDSDLGAQLSTMFMVEYEALKGVIGGHDHPLEETYLILEGEVDATFDGQRYHMVAGDVAWAGVGCVHAFADPAGCRCGGSRPSRPRRRPVTRTGSSATGST